MRVKAAAQAAEKKYYMAALYGADKEGQNPSQVAELLQAYNKVMTNHGISSQDMDTFATDNVHAPQAQRLPPSDAGCPF